MVWGQAASWLLPGSWAVGLWVWVVFRVPKAVLVFSPGTKEAVVKAHLLGQGGLVLQGAGMGVPACPPCGRVSPHPGSVSRLVTVNLDHMDKHFLKSTATGRNTAHQLIPLPSLQEFLQASALYVS